MSRATDFRELLLIALRINDKLRIHADHVEFTGSMNDAEDLREVVNRLHNFWGSSDFGPGGLWRDENGNWREPGSGIRG